jgi:hypothetical protein
MWWVGRIALLGALILVGLTLDPSAVVPRAGQPVCRSSSPSSTGLEDLVAVSEEAP